MSFGQTGRTKRRNFLPWIKSLRGHSIKFNLMGVAFRKKGEREWGVCCSLRSHAANYARAGPRATHTGKWQVVFFAHLEQLERQGRVDEMTAPGKCFCSLSVWLPYCTREPGTKRTRLLSLHWAKVTHTWFICASHQHREPNARHRQDSKIGLAREAICEDVINLKNWTSLSEGLEIIKLVKHGCRRACIL